MQDYGYNTRDELISGQGLTYNYDDIGNRTTAEGKVYTANELNQYTVIDTFEPQYDADGNQALIKTSTGVFGIVKISFCQVAQVLGFGVGVGCFLGWNGGEKGWLAGDVRRCSNA